MWNDVKDGVQATFVAGTTEQTASFSDNTLGKGARLLQDLLYVVGALLSL